MSTNITVRSIVGSFLEHARILYFIKNPVLKQQVINILVYDLRDNVNSYLMQEDGTYVKITPGDAAPFNIHKAFFELNLDEVMKARLLNRCGLQSVD